MNYKKCKKWKKYKLKYDHPSECPMQEKSDVMWGVYENIMRGEGDWRDFRFFLEFVGFAEEGEYE